MVMTIRAGRPANGVRGGGRMRQGLSYQGGDFRIVCHSYSLLPIEANKRRQKGIQIREALLGSHAVHAQTDLGWHT